MAADENSVTVRMLREDYERHNKIRRDRNLKSIQVMSLLVRGWEALSEKEQARHIQEYFSEQHSAVPA